MSAGVLAFGFSDLGLFTGILRAAGLFLAIAAAALLLQLASVIAAQHGGLL